MRPIGSFLCGAVLTALTVIWIHVAAVAVGASVYALPEVLLFVVIGVALGTRAAARSTSTTRNSRSRTRQWGPTASRRWRY